MFWKCCLIKQTETEMYLNVFIPFNMLNIVFHLSQVSTKALTNFCNMDIRQATLKLVFVQSLLVHV